MSNSSRGTSDSVHQANLATFRSFRKTIEELTLKPRTVLGDHASLVKRIQEWRKTVSALTVWVTDDRAYYQQARPEIVSMLEAVFDSVRAVDTVRSQIAEPNWVKASEKEFEFLLRRLAEVRGIPMEQRRVSATQLAQSSTPPQPAPSVPSNFQNTPVPPHTVSQGYIEKGVFQNGAEALHMRPYTQSANIARTNSLPMGGVTSIRPTIISSHTTPITTTIQELPQLPHLSTPSQGKPQDETQGTLAKRPSTPPAIQPTTDGVTSIAADAAPVNAPSEGQDWDLDLNWDELEALDRSEWQAGDPMQAAGDAHMDPTANAAEGPMGALPESGPSSALQVQLNSVNELNTSANPKSGELSTGPPLAQPKELVSDLCKSEAEDSSAQMLLVGREHAQVLEHSEYSTEDIIDIDELPGDEVTTGPSLEAQKQPSTESAPSNLDEDIINIQYSDDEMEVDELDPSEPAGSVRQSEQPDDEHTGSVGQTKPSLSQTHRPSAVVKSGPIQLPIELDSLPPGVLAEIRQKAKEPLIAHYLSIQPSETWESAEKRFEQMSDQDVLNIYDKMGHARRIVDHYKNRLVHSSHKLRLPHIDVRDPPKDPPTLLCSVAGAMRLSSETVEFSISSATMGSIERWRDRFVTAAGYVIQSSLLP
ncbi:unnamed protein product [Rhizoctonia solani]|uniref:Uncharacterized protein n=1 Tax=Rhizoctonia solani TaxID=456999 RepID=A0A8H2ZYK4_9AGAM|nr:unnamed protein product [Rhizoctonia solani]